MKLCSKTVTPFLILAFLINSVLELRGQNIKDNACQDQPAVLDTGTGTIYGSMLMPSQQGEVPVGLIIAGSGPTDRNGNSPVMKNNALKMLAEDLCKNNIATLRYDKRGIGQSQPAGLQESDLRFDNYVDDAVGWIHQLKTDKRFSKVIVIGHSEGSLIGMVASEKTHPDAFISIAGAGESADKLLKKQLKNQPDSVQHYAFPVIDSLAAGKTVDNINPTYNALFRPSVQPYLISWFKYDPKEEISKLNIPVLIIQGSTDIQVDQDNAFELLYAAKNVDLQIIEGMNHIMKKADPDRIKNMATYNNPDLPVMNELIQDIAQFIRK